MVIYVVCQVGPGSSMAMPVKNGMNWLGKDGNRK